jgi:hypothetical protein
MSFLPNFDTHEIADKLSVDPIPESEVWRHTLQHLCRRYSTFIMTQEIRRHKRHRKSHDDALTTDLYRWIHAHTYGIVFSHYLMSVHYKKTLENGDAKPSAAKFCALLDDPSLRETYRRMSADWSKNGWLTERGDVHADIVKINNVSALELQAEPATYHYIAMSSVCNGALHGYAARGETEKEQADSVAQRVHKTST